MMDAVIVRLMGGLGNQMFQYATGYALAQRHRVRLLLDRNFLDHRPGDMTWTPRDFELDVFQAPIAFATAAEVRRMRRPVDERAYRIGHRLLPFLFPDHCFRERAMGFDPMVNVLRPPIYLEGYWQNENYFTSIASVLRDALFIPREQPSARNRELLSAIQGTRSASIHVRRGDYVSDAAIAQFHGVCPPEYYTSAARLLAEEHGVEHFFIFSDEPGRVRAEIHLPYTRTLVAHNTGREAHWDLWLMKQCTHHIIANSSFSWWGAWLNGSPGKQVIAPARWHQGHDTSSSDILPPTWIAR